MALNNKDKERGKGCDWLSTRGKELGKWELNIIWWSVCCCLYELSTTPCLAFPPSFAYTSRAGNWDNANVISGGVGNLWLQIPTCLVIYTTYSIYIIGAISGGFGMDPWLLKGLCTVRVRLHFIIFLHFTYVAPKLRNNTYWNRCR